mgnify:CR=1 FL=1
MDLPGRRWQAGSAVRGPIIAMSSTVRLRLVCVSLGLLFGVRIEFGIGVHCLTDQIAVTVIVLLGEPCRVMTQTPGSVLPMVVARGVAASVRTSR